MVKIGDNLVGAGSKEELAKIESNPHGLKCKKCDTFLDLRKMVVINTFRAEVNCPKCHELNSLYRDRRLKNKRKDGSIITDKKKGLSKKQRKALRRHNEKEQ